MAEEKVSVHDNIVLSYEVNCREQRIVMRTCFKVGTPPFEHTDVVFEGVCAYKFQDDWLDRGNILFNVERVELKALVDRYEEDLLAGWRYGWPPVGSFKTIPQLIERLEALQAAAFEISASCGLCGFVLARTMQFVPRDAE